MSVISVFFLISFFIGSNYATHEVTKSHEQKKCERKKMLCDKEELFHLPGADKD